MYLFIRIIDNRLKEKVIIEYTYVYSIEEE